MRKVLVVFVILLVGGVIAADRIGVLVVQDRIGRQVAAEYNLSSQPDVTIHGFPFLTQAIGGEYDQIDVGLGEWTQQGVTLRDVKIEMHGVQAPLSEVQKGNSANVVARTAVASAIVPYDLVQRYAPKEVTRIGPKGSDLEVDLTGGFAGFPLSGTAVVSVKASKQGVVITPQSVGNAGLQIPLNLLQRRTSFTVPVKALPVGSRVSKVEVTPEGLRVAATATNVHLNNLPQS